MNICEKHGPSPRAKDPAARASDRDFGAKTVDFDPISGGPGRIAGDRGPRSGGQLLAGSWRKGGWLLAGSWRKGGEKVAGCSPAVGRKRSPW